jgi:hypothetical protein
MKVRWNQLMVAVALGAAVLLMGFGLTGKAAAQPPVAAPKTQTAGEAFKNVTTSTLKGLTVSDFLGSMGVMAAALGLRRLPSERRFGQG